MNELKEENIAGKATAEWKAAKCLEISTAAMKMEAQLPPVSHSQISIWKERQIQRVTGSA